MNIYIEKKAKKSSFEAKKGLAEDLAMTVFVAAFTVCTWGRILWDIVAD